MRKRRLLRGLRAILITILISVVTLEIALAVFDPYGVRYLRESAFYNRNYVPHPTRSYVLLPGLYDFGRWQATVNGDYERFAPDSVPGCRVVFLGDSVTFGRGVNDDETFVNLLARELRIDAVNTGVDAYNSRNVLNTLNDYEADLFVWLIFKNDDDATLHLAGEGETIPQAADHVYRYDHLRDLYSNSSGIASYIQFLKLVYPETSQPERFAEDMAAMSAVDNLVMLMMDDEFGRAVAGRYDVHLIPPYTSALSIADAHADRDGHRQLAEGMLPVVESAVAEHCGG